MDDTGIRGVEGEEQTQRGKFVYDGDAEKDTSIKSHEIEWMMKRERKGDKSETKQKEIQACLNYKLKKSLLKSLNKPDSKSHHKLNTIEDLKDSVKPLFVFLKPIFKNK